MIDPQSEWIALDRAELGNLNRYSDPDYFAADVTSSSFSCS